MSRRKTYGKTTDGVLKRLHQEAEDWGGAFTPSDFADLGDPRIVGMVLSRLVKNGVIRRVQRGVYELPQTHPILGRIGADSDAVVKAIARREGSKFLPSGAASANALGLSTQVPARVRYGVAGASRDVQVGEGSHVQLRHRSSRAMALAGRAGGWLSEALRNLGADNITPQKVTQLRKKFPPEARKELLEDIRYVPAWMRPIFQEVARDE